MLNDSNPVMLSVNDTAKAFGISSYHARQLALTGAVKAVRIGRSKILINQQSVAKYFDSCYLSDNETHLQSKITPISVRG